MLKTSARSGGSRRSFSSSTMNILYIWIMPTCRSAKSFGAWRSAEARSIRSDRAFFLCVVLILENEVRFSFEK